MRTQFRWTALSLCTFSMLGCADSLTTPVHRGPTPGRDLDTFVPLAGAAGAATPAPDGGASVPEARSSTSTTQSGEMPAEYLVPASIKNPVLRPGFFEGTAFATAEADLFGTHKLQVSTVNLRQSGSVLATASDHEGASGIWPSTHHLVSHRAS